MLDRITMPPEFLPLIDDAPRLRVLADYIEENPSAAGSLSAEQHAYLLKLLRATARLWSQTPCVGIPRKLVREGMLVWARFSSQGWTRAEVESVGGRSIHLTFPYRPHAGSGLLKRGRRAWWDLEPRGMQSLDECWPPITRWPKPAPRIGYGTGVNAMLAAALAFDPRPKVAMAGGEQPGLFEEMTADA